MSDMIDKMSHAMFVKMESEAAREIHKDLMRKSLAPLLDLPEDLIIAGMTGVIDSGRYIVGPKDVTVPFYAVINAILGEDNGN